MNSIKIGCYSITFYTEISDPESILGLSALSLLITFKNKLCLLHTHKHTFISHSFNSFCINCAIVGWEASVTSRCISHQSSKAMQILHSQTCFPLKKNICFVLVYIWLEEHQIHISGATLVAL